MVARRPVLGLLTSAVLLAVLTAGQSLADFVVPAYSQLAQPAPAPIIAPTPTSVYFHLRQDRAPDHVAADIGEQLGARPAECTRRPGTYMLNVPAGVGTDTVLEQLRANPAVEFAHPQLVIQHFLTPDDELFGPRPPGFDPLNPEHYVPYYLLNQDYLFQVNAPQAWDLETGSSDVVIAIVDSGISAFHEDLADNIWHNTLEENGTPGVDDDGNGWVDDFIGYDFVGDNVGNPATDDYNSYDTDPTVWDPAWWPSDYVWDTTWTPEEVQLPDVDPAIGNAIDDNDDGIPDLGVMHGTQVAGMAAAVTNNEVGVAGIGYESSLMAVRVTDPEGFGDGFNAADGIRYAADAGADIINCSWGVYDYNPDNFDDPDTEEGAIRDAILYALDRGCIVVCAAGNAGAEGLAFPACLPETISVGMVGMEGEWYGSNYAADGEILDCVAPGWDLQYRTGVNNMYMWTNSGWSLVFPDIPPDMPPDTEDNILLGEDLYLPDFGGTSFSAPMVSGFAALMRARFPDLTNEQLRHILHVSSNSGTRGTYDPYYGYGLLDAYEGILYGDEYIPEPMTTTLFIVGVGALALKLRRRRS